MKILRLPILVVVPERSAKVTGIDFSKNSLRYAKQDLKLITPIEVTDNSIANLTIIVDPYSWFDDNGNILDPNDPTNESLIEDNIKQSFKKIIIDNNYDGLPD